MKLNWNFQRGRGGGGHRANPLCGEYGYFLELHIHTILVKTMQSIVTSAVELIIVDSVNCL